VLRLGQPILLDEWVKFIPFGARHTKIPAFQLGWWIPGIIRQETRHYWIITTIFVGI
jgi:hypothetical protein